MSETVRTLTELRHTPASPSLLRRKITAQTQAQVQAPTAGYEKVLARVEGVTTAAASHLASCAVERASGTVR